ncbi:hypothetical protein BDR04DRAFT_170001 [Suillus decipiens]|nr:hypothetical protein BDR04DRAFT_170001 [Suillus decipiens]
MPSTAIEMSLTADFRQQKLVPQCLDMCDVLTIRRFFRKAWCYMDAYQYVYHCFRVIMWQH